MNKMFIRDAALLPVVQFQKDGYLRNQHNILYQISVVPKIFKRVAWKGRSLVEKTEAKSGNKFLFILE